MPDVHTSRFRQRILAQFPYWAYMSRREYILAYDKTVGYAMLQTYKRDPDEDALAVLRVVKTVIRDILQHTHSYNDYFYNQSQCKSVLRSLLADD